MLGIVKTQADLAQYEGSGHLGKSGRSPLPQKMSGRAISDTWDSNRFVHRALGPYLYLLTSPTTITPTTVFSNMGSRISPGLQI